MFSLKTQGYAVEDTQRFYLLFSCVDVFYKVPVFKGENMRGGQGGLYLFNVFLRWYWSLLVIFWYQRGKTKVKER